MVQINFNYKTIKAVLNKLITAVYMALILTTQVITVATNFPSWTPKQKICLHLLEWHKLYDTCNDVIQALLHFSLWSSGGKKTGLAFECLVDFGKTLGLRFKSVKTHTQPTSIPLSYFIRCLKAFTHCVMNKQHENAKYWIVWMQLLHTGFWWDFPKFLGEFYLAIELKL